MCIRDREGTGRAEVAAAPNGNRPATRADPERQEELQHRQRDALEINNDFILATWRLIEQPVVADRDTGAGLASREPPGQERRAEGRELDAVQPARGRADQDVQPIAGN